MKKKNIKKTLKESGVQQKPVLYFLSVAIVLYAFSCYYIQNPGTPIQMSTYYLLGKISNFTGLWQVYNIFHCLDKILPIVIGFGAVLLFLIHFLKAKFASKKLLLLVFLFPFSIFDYFRLANFLVCRTLDLFFTAIGVLYYLSFNKNLCGQKLRPLAVFSILLISFAGLRYLLPGNSIPFIILGYLCAFTTVGICKFSTALETKNSKKLGMHLKKMHLVILALIFLLAFFLRYWNLMGDLSLRYAEGYSAYAGYELIQGFAIYRDFFYTHVPLLPYALASFYHVFGAGLFQARMFNLLVNLFSMVPLYFIARKFYGEKIAQLTIFIWAVHPHTVSMGRSLVMEPFMVFLILISVLLFINARKNFHLLTAGSVLGLATLAKEPAALTLIPFLVYARKSPKKFLILLAGFFIPLLILIYFYTIAPENFSKIVQFHATVPQVHLIEKLHIFFGEFSRFSPTILLLPTISIFYMLKKRTEKNLFVLVWFLSTLLLLLNRAFSGHYVLQLMPVFCIFTSLGIIYLTELVFTSKKEKYLKNIMFFCIFSVLALAFFYWDSGIITFNDNTTLDVADILRNVTARDELVVASQLSIPLLAERNIPGELYEFSYHNKLLRSDRVIEVIEEKNVSAIVLEWRLTCEGADHLREFVTYVHNNYKKVASFKNDTISIWIK